MYTILLVILLTAAAVDLLTFKIPNRIIVWGIALGILCRLFYGGWMEAAAGAAGIFIPSCLLLVLYRFRVIGAGDVKLFSVAGSFLGITDTINALLPVLFFSGALSFVCFIIYFFRERDQIFQKCHKIPMAVPVFLGILWHLQHSGAL